MNALQATFDIMRNLKQSSRIKTKRNFEEFFSDRILQSFTEATLLDAIERLSKSIGAQIEYVGGAKMAAFLAAANGPEASGVLAWIRRHPNVSAMIAALRDETDYAEAMERIQLDQAAPEDNSTIRSAPEYQVRITVELLSPLSHGGDMKAGNATLFRRRQVITETGRILSLPFYSGNAVRGQMRDLLADHLLLSLGLAPRRDKPPLAIWFFHCLYAGGVLEEQSRVMNDINKELGKNGSIRTDGLRRLRDMLPALSVLGLAVGNRVIPGRVCVGDLRPHCLEWGTGTVPAAQLMDWSFLTRREDYEGRGEDDGHTGMIVNTEVIKAGAVLSGGLDIDFHAGEIERSAIGMGIRLLDERGMLGAENRRGFGKFAMVTENAPDPDPYARWLDGNRQAILDYLDEIGGLAKCMP